MKLGFTLKKSKKTGLLAPGPTQGDHNGKAVSHAFEAAPMKKSDDAEKVYVTDFDPTAVAPNPADKKATLVIPLLKTNEWKTGPMSLDDEPPVVPSAIAMGTDAPVETEQKPELTEDEAAAQQLLADVQAQQNGDSGSKKLNTTLVIPMKNGVGGDAEDSLAEKRAMLYNLSGAKSEAATTKAVPILQQNVVPGMDELADVTEKFRHDVELRPNELDVHSEVYDNVPIEDFGAAMLRGMGWKGSMDEENPDADDPKPRQKLLGLGATAKPKVAGDTGKNGRRQGGNEPRTNRLNRREDDKKSDTKARSSSKERSKKHDRDSREKRSRSRDRESHKDREPPRRSRSDRETDDRRNDRDRGRSRDRDQHKERERSRDRDRNRERDRDRGRDRRDDRDKRKRSRSRERSSDRKKSSRR